MKKNYLLYLALILLTACGEQAEDQATTANPSDAGMPVGEDHFPHKVQPELARHFTVSYHGNYKIVKTNATLYAEGSEAAGEDQNDLLVLVQKGTSPPTLKGDLQNAQLISVPVATAAVNVQHSESFLRELGLEDRITAIGGLYSYNNEMRNKALSGEIGQVGYSWHSPPNIEVLLDRKPELFLMTLAGMDHTESLEKCRQLGIPTAAVFDWAEEDYLARAEWLKFYALFFNAEASANRVFQQIAGRIQELKELAADTPKASAIWGFYTSKGQWVMNLTSFPGQYLRDANLDNILLANTKPNANGLQAISTEQLLVRAKEADHWVIGDIHAAPLPKEEIMSSFRAWNSGQLYHNMQRVDPKTNTSDWYATAIVRPDTVLADLIKLVHPKLLPDYEPVFIGNYDKTNQGISATQ
jgi:ABC-type Fe3+-hydroxamate transport system substrate-binding protein